MDKNNLFSINSIIILVLVILIFRYSVFIFRKWIDIDEEKHAIKELSNISIRQQYI